MSWGCGRRHLTGVPQGVVALEAAEVLARGPSGMAIAWVSRDAQPLAALQPLALVLDPHASPGLPPAHPGWRGLAAAGGGAASGPRMPERSIVHLTRHQADYACKSRM